MSDAHELGSGIEYPKITLDGREFTLKISRAVLYRLDKAGFDLRTLADEMRRWLPRGESQPGYVRLSVLADVLHAAIGSQIPGATPEDVAEMIEPEQTGAIAAALIIALSKMQPANRVKLRESSANPAAPIN